MKWIAVGLAAVAMLGCLSNAQLPGIFPPGGGGTGFGGYGGQQTTQPDGGKGGGSRDPTQSKKDFELPINWKYPSDPTKTPIGVGTEEVRTPVVAVTVAVACEHNSAHVEVKKDFFGTGYIIDAADIKLGTCGPIGEDAGAGVLIFDTQLEGCDSSLMTTDNALIYGFSLNYDPQSGNSPVVRSSTVAVTVECHYPRKHNVSSLALNPHWIPFSSTKVVEELLFFSLTMMTEDWQYARPINQYYLGDLINIQATVQQYFHVPLRVYVDSCVATVSPDANSQPRYAFIDNDGCMVDAALTGSSSRFMQRQQDNKLDFQLEAFRFQDVDTDTFYITCHLTATSAAHTINSENRACSYINGWKEANGPQNNDVCNTCGQVIAEAGSSGGRLSDTTGGAGTGMTGGHTSGGSFTGGSTGGGSSFTGGSASGTFSSGSGTYSGGSTSGSFTGGSTSGYSGGSGTHSGGSTSGGTYSGGSAGGSGGSFAGFGTSSGGFGSGGSTGGAGRFTGSTGSFTGGGGTGGTGSRFTGGSTGSFTGGSKKAGRNKRGAKQLQQQQQQEQIVWHGYVGLGPLKIQERMEFKP